MGAGDGGISVNFAIEEGNADGVIQDIVLSHGGVMTSIAYLGREPLRNTRIDIYSEALKGYLETFHVTTDSKGHF